MLADVGFGECFDAPVPIALGVSHQDTNGMFRLESVDDRWTDLVGDGGPQYRFDAVARSIEDFAPGYAFHQTGESHFTKNTICSIRTDDGRVTLRGLTLVRRVASSAHAEGDRREEVIDAADLAAVAGRDVRRRPSSRGPGPPGRREPPLTVASTGDRMGRGETHRPW